MFLQDLRKAYLQIHVDEALRPHQTVMLKSQRYCFTQLGFGLNVALLIMQSIIDSVMSQNRTIKNVISTYIDDIYANEGLVPAACVREHLSNYGLICKEKLEHRTKVLGLQVWGNNGTH